MYKKRVTAMKIGPDTYKEIMNRQGNGTLPNAQFRSMLVSIKPGCYVETLDGRCGKVAEVKRDKYDIPVSVRVTVKTVDHGTDKVIERSEWINTTDIFFWEAWDFIAPEYLFEDDNAIIGEMMFVSEVT